MVDDLMMKGTLGWQYSYDRSMKAAGKMWAGPRCANVEGCCIAQKCIMSGACEDIPRERTLSHAKEE